MDAGVEVPLPRLEDPPLFFMEEGVEVPLPFIMDEGVDVPLPFIHG